MVHPVESAPAAAQRVAHLATQALSPLTVIDPRLPAHLAGYVVTGAVQLLPELRSPYFARAKSLLGGFGPLDATYPNSADLRDLVRAGARQR